MQDLKGLAEVRMLCSMLYADFLPNELVSVHQTVRGTGGRNILAIDRLVRDRLDHALYNRGIRC